MPRALETATAVFPDALRRDKPVGDFNRAGRLHGRTN
jgi:hypothetical protein